ncbi:MAG: alpha/beta hydrolase [Actinomycetota bacterium]|nr:alpha/beta hydrolase [Actinomycetota bacterium]
MKRFAVAFACCLILAACGDNGAPSSRATAKSSPFSGKVDIGDRSLYLKCDGSGSPTVIFEAGLTGDHRTWDQVLPRTGAKSRACAYDRANIDPSDPAPTPRTVTDMVADLHKLLRASGEKPPYVLAGFSFGGLAAQLYASTYPDEVVGMVLVESNHPDEVEQFEAELTPAQIAEDRKSVSENTEGIDVFASFKEMQAPSRLPDLPLVVVTAGVPEEWPPGWDAKVFNRLRAEQQADLVRLVPGGDQVIADKSAHNVPLEQPDVVVKAVQSVLSKAK